MGRKDIYKVDVEQVTPPLNIGITVNTQRDEFGFMVDASGQWGYFSSDISGKRCIYRYRLGEEVACPPASYLRLLTVNEAGEPVIPDGLTLTEVGTGDPCHILYIPSVPSEYDSRTNIYTPRKPDFPTADNYVDHSPYYRYGRIFRSLPQDSV